MNNLQASLGVPPRRWDLDIKVAFWTDLDVASYRWCTRGVPVAIPRLLHRVSIAVPEGYNSWILITKDFTRTRIRQIQYL